MGRNHGATYCAWSLKGVVVGVKGQEEAKDVGLN